LVPVAVTVAADATCGEIIESVETAKTKDKRLTRDRRILPIGCRYGNKRNGLRTWTDPLEK
jgi:hypothetical protein